MFFWNYLHWMKQFLLEVLYLVLVVGVVEILVFVLVQLHVQDLFHIL